MSSDATSKLFEKLKVYKNYSNDSIFFKYIFDENDISDQNSKRSMEDDGDSFKPEYTHQIFGDDEIIFGYKNLHIDYYLTPGTLDAYIGVKSREKISPSRYDGIEPDDVYSSFKEFGCSPGFTKNIDNFCSDKMKKDLEFTPWGEKISEYNKEVESKQSTYEIYKMDSSSTDYETENFINYLDRVQTMLVYYIETSNFLDPDDPNWVHYFLYEKRKNTASVPGKQSNEYRYLTIGYLSVYRYYAYPDKTRSRISQIMVFPKYQNAGHGSELVEAVLRDVNQNPNIVDVTAEAPSTDFIRLRDFVTTKMCSSLPVFQNKEMLKKGFTAEMASEARKHFKIPKLQSKRCYEVLRMACTNQHNAEEWRNYRLDIKKRFYKPFLNKSKYARNAGGSLPQDSEDAGDAATSAGSSSGMSKSFENRFGGAGGSSSRFGKINEEEEEESVEGVTTIGFGGNSASKSSSKPVKIVSFGNRMEPESTTQIGFGSKATPVESTTTIGFGNPSKVTKSVSFSNTPAEAENDEGDDENENKIPTENLFMTDKEKKKYLEQEFQACVDEYTKIIKRLEDKNILV